jgi:hypothetical protein
VRKIVFFWATLIFGLLPLVPAQAGFKTFVSASGSDENTCTLSSPCATMGKAVSETFSGGIVSCLDGSDYSGQVTITGSITIDCETFQSGIGPFIVNGSGITVVIRGGIIFVEGAPGIEFQNGAALSVERVQIIAVPAGIYFEPTANAALFVSDSLIINNSNGTNTPSGGIWVKPASGMTADVTIDRTRIENNTFGIVADGTAGGIVSGAVSDSVVSGNSQNGITVSSGGSSVVLQVDRTTVVENANHGLAAAGSGAGMLVSNSNVFNNGGGLFTENSGALFSYGNNHVNGNHGNDGTFTGTVGQQ